MNQNSSSASAESTQKQGLFASFKRTVCPFFVQHGVAIVFLLAVTVCALVLRIAVYDDPSWDYQQFLSKWYNVLKENGGFKGIATVYKGQTASDYCPSYLYILAFLTYIPVNSLYAIKTVSVVFDFVLAVYVGLIVRHAGKSDTGFMLGYACTLFLPNVFLNSAVWAQCDVIYTCFTVMSFYYLIKGKGISSMVFFGLAFSFKLQAVFFLPVIVVAVMKKKIAWQAPAFAVIPYFLMGVPALLLGAPFVNTYGTFLVQMGEYPSLTMNAPNLYTWVRDLSEAFTEDLATGMTFGAIGITGVALLPLLRYRFQVESDDLWIVMTAFFAVLIPYVLPHMHERYYYMSDIFALIFIIRNPKKWYVGVACILPSLFVVMKYLYFTHEDLIKLSIWAIVLLAGVCMMGSELYTSVQARLLTPAENPPVTFGKGKGKEE